MVGRTFGPLPGADSQEQLSGCRFGARMITDDKERD
jgi:hypothetical protein